MKELSIGKDTITSHWRFMSLQTKRQFKIFPNEFPQSLNKQLKKKTSRRVIGNKVASGTKIIEELGQEHLETGAMIVYTSADSVVQIAAHEQVIPLKELYEICEIARKLTLDEQYRIGRVIARPFIGELGNFERTENRHDYAIKPFNQTVMNFLKDDDYDVISLGKIEDIFDGEGITKAYRTKDNDDGMIKLKKMLNQSFCGLCFLNLVDFDALYGHRRDPKGYGRALERFDQQLPEVFEKLREDDLLIITADHGNDPTHHGTDHTREYVPLIVYHQGITEGKELPIRKSFADVGATIADNFNVKLPEHGESFLTEIK